jgi:hypothetical protein
MDNLTHTKTKVHRYNQTLEMQSIRSAVETYMGDMIFF